MSVVGVALTHCLCAPALSAQGGVLPVQSPVPGRIRGQVFDSLRMQPVPRATVMLMDGTETVISDAKGRFELAGIPPGKHFVAFNTPSIDSLGLGTLGAQVDVPSGAIANVNLATPSIHTLWLFRCRNEFAAGDSAIVWGTIRDASTNAELIDASAELNWYALQAALTPGMKLREIRKDVGTDAEGHYFACGVPSDIVISSIAVSPSAASGNVQFVIGDQRFKRLDLLVSSDMVIPDSVHLLTHKDSVAADHARGHATLTGVVTDERKRPLENAIVSIATADTSVRTDKAGEFSLALLPAGTQIVEVRRVGFAPFLKVVELRPVQSTEVAVEMPVVSTLTTVNVRANKVKNSELIDYDQRKKMGFGTFIEAKDLAGRSDVATPLSRVAGVHVDYTEAGFEVTMKSPFMSGTCTPAIFLDGFPTTVDVINFRPADSFRAIEVYAHGGSVPVQYATLNGCGSILFWSATARR
jgi:hypothetical protein